ncbi:hypothetical protein METBIDRAFT_30517 [Metschnikowia bicuspidata var. bicuspidata NRRL YB-4993]|uniref:Uncharacterized protein n=1 Tax=Metschnikowia bicuspidata var. bicuspidata NRRL YB-4993 TaxID=869754 RepID=A0A1A0HJX0_9ASCO|nr:hypothetical protein METBIDRAFT_30517 [Metschnikowia bicuspidata var. bicuspidata NRRL YB-4993]OBA24182.1 hypothetical protein METBIDRAFT_30517 [Metschnikowia bicuspidata var. bicuspidata NRRL YB-4993]
MPIKYSLYPSNIHYTYRTLPVSILHHQEPSNIYLYIEHDQYPSNMTSTHQTLTTTIQRLLQPPNTHYIYRTPPVPTASPLLKPPW